MPSRIAPWLAWRNVRHRPAHAALLLLTLTLATSTLGVGMWLYGSADAPWDRAWARTEGFHVQALAYRDRDDPRGDAALDEARDAMAALAADPEVVAVGGPWVHLYGLLEAGGGTEDLTAEVRPSGVAAVDQPLVTAGAWLDDGDPGVVLEHGLAEAMHAGPGDTVRLQGWDLPVRGVAITVSRGRFPLTRPAHVWVTPATAAELRALGMTEEGLQLGVRLRDADDAAAVVARHAEPIEGMFVETWRQRRADSHSDVDVLAGTVFAAGILVGLLAVATAAVIVAGRMAAHARQTGTLKAVGALPRQVVAVLLVEHLALAAVATVVGLAVARAIAPPLARSSLTLLGAPEPPPLSWARLAIVGGVAAGAVVVATLRPALRAARHSSLRSLASGARPPRRRGRLAGLADRAGAPLPAVLGLRSAWRRPGRLVSNAAGLTLAVAMVVVAVALHTSLDRLAAKPTEAGHSLSARADAVLYDRVTLIVLATAGLLVVLGGVNAAVVASFAARDSARAHATLRALGATPRQTVAALVVSQMSACVLAVAAGIPLGLGLWQLMDGGDLPPVPVPAGAVAGVAVVVPLVFAAVVSVPGWRRARRPAGLDLGAD
jgi:putative ABC transport system permease protein